MICKISLAGVFLTAPFLSKVLWSCQERIGMNQPRTPSRLSGGRNRKKGRRDGRWGRMGRGVKWHACAAGNFSPCGDSNPSKRIQHGEDALKHLLGPRDGNGQLVTPPQVLWSPPLYLPSLGRTLNPKETLQVTSTSHGALPSLHFVIAEPVLFLGGNSFQKWLPAELVLATGCSWAERISEVSGQNPCVAQLRSAE